MVKQNTDGRLISPLICCRLYNSEIPLATRHEERQEDGILPIDMEHQ